MKKLRMYYLILGTKPYHKEVSSAEKARIMIDAISSFVNAKVDEGVFPDHCSTAGLEEDDEEIIDASVHYVYRYNGMNYKATERMEPHFIGRKRVSKRQGDTFHR